MLGNLHQVGQLDLWVVAEPEPDLNQPHSKPQPLPQPHHPSITYPQKTCLVTYEMKDWSRPVGTPRVWMPHHRQQWSERDSSLGRARPHPLPSHLPTFQGDAVSSSLQPAEAHDCTAREESNIAADPFAPDCSKGYLGSGKLCWVN